MRAAPATGVVDGPAEQNMSGGKADLAVARRVIRAEIRGLESLADGLDGSFRKAVDACAAALGRIIVTGIGKSGHVARKIAATLASTGTPAQFVHGDVGADQLAVNALLPHPPGDELGVLRAEIEDRDHFVVLHPALLP